MILYQRDLHPNFLEYGIQIPIADDRASKTFEELQKKYPKIQSIPFDQTLALSDEDLLLAHTKEYVDKLKTHPIDAVMESYELKDQQGNYHRFSPDHNSLPLTKLIEHKLKQASGTYQAAKYSLTHPPHFCFYLGGGMHHAMSFHGRGFCLINDVVIAIRKMQKEKLIKHAWVIDLDAHKGDGTAEITKDDSSITTLSIHMKDGWPLDDGDASKPWHIPSDIDIPLAMGEEQRYLQKLQAGLENLEKDFPHPDLCLVVDGSDPFEADELASSGLLRLNKEQMLERDQLVYRFLKNKKIPQTYVIAGGYGKRAWEIYYQFLDGVLRENF